jgi:hypothetical protein
MCVSLNTRAIATNFISEFRERFEAAYEINLVNKSDF